MISCTSPPEEKFSPAPVTITTLIALSDVQRSNVSRSSV